MSSPKSIGDEIRIPPPEKQGRQTLALALVLKADTAGTHEAVMAGLQTFHAGDVGDPSILCALEDIAPVVAVRGNTDKGSWSLQLPKTEMVPVGDAFVYLIHDIHELDLDPRSAGIRVIVHGHTHQPSIKHHHGVLYLNPGGAGHRRFDYPVSVATLDILHMDIVPRIISLDIG